MIKEFLNPDRVTLRMGRVLAKVSSRPNVWTIISVIPAIAGFYLVWRHSIIWSVVCFLLSGFLDSIDGAVARCQDKSTYLGAFIDGTVDRFVDFLLIFSFLFLAMPDILFSFSWWVVIGAYFALMPTFTVAYANHRKAVPDPTEKVIWRILHRSEMYPLFLIALLAAAFSLTTAAYLFIFTAILSIITTFQTIYLVVKKSKNYPQN
ncbi:MAG: hypothetical protein COY66_05660 [Candidatus Kerfeldbacteria bacterium CG_4_10_14_0_8_um_filter_42_10]|uniref:CDP-alcohol phosphatidyltransferase family protein n=1 Tax=Candidatus Kerfeldbacteria bacterium CG_4_10_14_0_8_um_filter_42_10 TaxID=2014248 RepID=A0A2M7RGN3_9BACT|nr:MAG: hypothetical protein COY66_05660 [Candidatus Kerfeldbacteria bacterium CG_4_10_14_0_8_um_filter_42_10]